MLAILKKALNKVREQKNRSIQSGESNTILPENDDVNQVLSTLTNEKLKLVEEGRYVDAENVKNRIKEIT